MSGMTKHVSKAGKVDPGDRVTLPVKFACKPELTLTRSLRRKEPKNLWRPGYIPSAYLSYVFAGFSVTP